MKAREARQKAYLKNKEGNDLILESIIKCIESSANDGNYYAIYKGDVPNAVKIILSDLGYDVEVGVLDAIFFAKISWNI